jgi:hypothetical protein
MPSPSEIVLAMLLSAQVPGRSLSARILVPDCDATCQSTRVCAEEVTSCAPPRWSARHQSFYRLETFDEGVQRYALIAEVMAEAAQAEGWPGTPRELWRMLVTLAYHEGGLRRDVHEGTTRGDCDYRERHGVAELIPGSCRSHCLGQIFLRPGDRTTRGYRADDLVGLDRAATTRCIETMVDRLSAARRSCEAQHCAKGPHPACVFAIYGGVRGTNDPRIRARVAAFERLGQATNKLDERARRALARQRP